ncbi:F0F1 ATP synthase subunit A [Candidatus Parcubacteria bacterium]|nr:F0F1 ATP synthase subunit A [Candidatus Parcubacteria bacterium]
MNVHIALSGEPMLNILGIEVTNTFILSVLIGLLMMIFFSMAFRKKEMVPNKIQNFFEWILEAVFNLFDGITGDRKKTEEVFPLSATLFLFILFNNLLEIVPGLGVFPILRSPSSDLHFTLALALFGMGFVHFSALKQLGFFTHMKKFINFKDPIMFFVGILEGIGEFTKAFSLGVRLFGNLFAGEVLLMIIGSMIPFIAPLPFMGLELFVAFVQALVFSSLITVFYVFHTEKHEH